MKEGKKFKVIECSGTPYEIGCQWGKAGKENILGSLEQCFKLINHVHQVPRENAIENAMKYLPVVKDFDSYLIDILKGQADGAGVSFEETFTLRCAFELFIHYNQIASLCTSFSATGKATKDGKTILGQNLDWYTGTPIDLIKIHHTNGVKQLSLFLWGIEVTLSSAGFGVCANGTWAPPQKYALNIPFGCYLPKVMRQKNMDDAMEILKDVARGLEYYHLADAGGNLVGIESIEDDLEILHPHRDILVHSNHYLTERFKKSDMASQIIPDSFQRIERIRKLIDSHYGKITPELMMEILSDHENFPNSICRHPGENLPLEYKPLSSETLTSFVMIPEDRIMFIAYGNPCKCEYIKYQLD
ncbi:MAG: hypothetical protein FH756_17200 [Firmicutes bacterium]|nr:hypothetical protein [Bacillota bacterium]